VNSVIISEKVGYCQYCYNEF